eukprot:CAMPEP_0172546694 /NCGR_PEP_ID=MMETSP1067-20121228/16402_1 /TAXON_ID=265564 ORGANISM="Thalassiosira punctigera, Strain Tpunct2005C2" /NCGR_SAMPLE_ID=MMETSP1067 /ASSEMBLY_ACC=CAM_ASM_000444 /LENGTH=53 /DNA_ID=CAMNT_0013333659 /DNA_START=21 /DNA_END=179 /DNA_ORIENTATION=+
MKMKVENRPPALAPTSVENDNRIISRVKIHGRSAPSLKLQQSPPHNAAFSSHA